MKHVLPAKLTNGEPGFNPGTGAKKKPEIRPSDLKVSDLNGKDRSLILVKLEPSGDNLVPIFGSGDLVYC